MFEKVLTNGVVVSYGASFPTTQVADGTLFYKTTASSEFPVGFYIYGTRPDTNTTVIGPQVGQGWFPVDTGDLYLKLTGGTLSGALALTSFIKISGSTTEQRIVLGNTSAVSPVIFASQNKQLKIGLGQSFSGSGGTLTPILTADFTDLANGLKWDDKKVWHAGNDGPSSGLDADLLDGLQSETEAVPNTIAARDQFGDLIVNKLRIDSPDTGQIGQFITTNGSDGYTKKASVALARETIRLDSFNDLINRKQWNIDIAGTAGTASEVSWNNITNKPSWLVNGSVEWDDITGKPTVIYKYSPDQTGQRSKSAEEYTADGRDVHSGIFAYSMVDMPGPDNSFKDPTGEDAFFNNHRNFWAGFQTITNGENGRAGIQLLGRWDAENVDNNGDGLTFEDNNAFLAFRVNDDNFASRNDNSVLNKFSPWIKIWTNTSLTSLGQLSNDVGYATNTDLSGYLKKTSPVEQELTGALVAFRNQVYGRNAQGTVSYSLDAATGAIESSGTITAGSDFKTTNGDFKTTNGKVWSDNGKVGTGAAADRGCALLYPGYTENGATLSGSLRLTNGNSDAIFGRILGDITNSKVRYEVDPDNVYGATGKYHWFNCTIKSTGDVVAYASDGRLKKNINTIKNASSTILSLTGRTYDWDIEKCSEVGFTPNNVHEHGLIAQEVQSIVPDAVIESAIPGYLTVKYDRLVPLLISAFSEQQTELVQLRNEVEHLKSIVSDLINKLS